MGVYTFSRTNIQRAEGSETLACQVRMHRTGRKDHRHRNAVGSLLVIGQDQMPRTRAHGIFGLGANTLQALAQSVMVIAGREGAVDLDKRRIEVARHLIPLGIADKGAVQHENLGLC